MVKQCLTTSYDKKYNPLAKSYKICSASPLNSEKTNKHTFSVLSIKRFSMYLRLLLPNKIYYRLSLAGFFRLIHLAVSLRLFNYNSYILNTSG